MKQKSETKKCALFIMEKSQIEKNWLFKNGILFVYKLHERTTDIPKIHKFIS